MYLLNIQYHRKQWKWLFNLSSYQTDLIKQTVELISLSQGVSIFLPSLCSQFIQPIIYFCSFIYTWILLFNIYYKDLKIWATKHSQCFQRNRNQIMIGINNYTSETIWSEYINYFIACVQMKDLWERLSMLPAQIIFYLSLAAHFAVVEWWISFKSPHHLYYCLCKTCLYFPKLA